MSSSKLNKKINAYMRRFPAVKNLTIVKSKVKNKRLCAIFILKGKNYNINFGLDTATTYYDDPTLKEKRKSYIARASKITNKKGQYTYKIPGTANSFAYYILW
jgi:hypothetical protein